MTIITAGGTTGRAASALCLASLITPCAAEWQGDDMSLATFVFAWLMFACILATCAHQYGVREVR
jgi:hypothetical protein